jgi:hypothetical protein
MHRRNVLVAEVLPDDLQGGYSCPVASFTIAF